MVREDFNKFSENGYYQKSRHGFQNIFSPKQTYRLTPFFKKLSEICNVGAMRWASVRELGTGLALRLISATSNSSSPDLEDLISQMWNL